MLLPAQISGNKVTSNCIFIPASGYYLPGSGWFYDVDRRGSFWTSQVTGSNLDYVELDILMLPN